MDIFFVDSRGIFVCMMAYGGSWGMMDGGTGLLGLITWLVIFVDLVLVGVWLWQQISKK